MARKCPMCVRRKGLELLYCHVPTGTWAEMWVPPKRHPNLKASEWRGIMVCRVCKEELLHDEPYYATQPSG